MKILLPLCVFSVALAAGAQTNAVPETTVEPETGLRADAGADLRVRQEIMHNVVGNPGDPGAMIELQLRLAESNLSDPDPPALASILFATHPPTVERIGAALAYERERAD